MAKEVLHLKGDPRCVEISEHPGVVDCSDVKATSVEASLAILLPFSQAEGALRKLRLKIFQVSQDKPGQGAVTSL